jgi:catechol 2,3-dioxygenase-like lactoylglutathione lyase family enzyme
LFECPSTKQNTKHKVPSSPGEVKEMKASFHHVNVTVPREVEDAAKHFYGTVMGLAEVPKPAESRGRGGAWYQLGEMQLHLSIENGPGDDCLSKRHVCYTVEDLEEAEEKFRKAGVEILSDDMPTPGWSRFYVRDPGGNRLEIAQR